MSAKEVSFVKDYVKSLKLFPRKVEASYEGNHGKPTVLEAMPIDVPAAEGAAAVNAQAIQVTLRSIRAPKFIVKYEVSDADSIYALKERLLADAESPLRGLGYPVSAVRLLIKSKAVADIRQLRELGATEFIVMLIGDPVPDAAPRVSSVPYTVPGRNAATVEAPPPEQDPDVDFPDTNEATPSLKRPQRPSGSDDGADEPDIGEIPPESSDPRDVAFWADVSATLAKHGRTDLLAKFKQAAR